jgi:hypothetical protein
MNNTVFLKIGYRLPGVPYQWTQELAQRTPKGICCRKLTLIYGMD